MLWEELSAEMSEMVSAEMVSGTFYVTIVTYGKGTKSRYWR